MARAMWAVSQPRLRWEDVHADFTGAYLKDATAALAAWEAHERERGMVSVPKELNGEMLKAYQSGLRNLIGSLTESERIARWGTPRKGKGYRVSDWEKAAARYKAIIAVAHLETTKAPEG